MSIIQDGAGGEGISPIDGKPDRETFFAYAADGSTRVENIDFSSDTPNDTILVDGESRGATHSYRVSSGGCANLPAWMRGAQPSVPGRRLKAGSAEDPLARREHMIGIKTALGAREQTPA